MAISINVGLSALPVTSNGTNTQRSFTPGQQISVAGQPRALQNRPQNSPGIIPMPTVTPVVVQRASEFDSDDDFMEKGDITYLIVKKILLKSDETDKPVMEPQKQRQVDIEVAPTNQTTPQTTVSEVNVTAEGAQEQPQAGGNISIPQSAVKQTDPLALDMDGNGLQVTGLHDGINFDIDADGQLDKTSFISGNDAFLALDRNGNNKIDDGGELFGDQGGAANGYQALAAYDDNNDGSIDKQDAVFSQLKLLFNNDGEFNTVDLSSSGITSISVNYQSTKIALNSYDSIAQLSSYEKEDGTTGITGDILLAQKV